MSISIRRLGGDVNDVLPTIQDIHRKRTDDRRLRLSLVISFVAGGEYSTK